MEISCPDEGAMREISQHLLQGELIGPYNPEPASSQAHIRAHEEVRCY